MSTKTLDIDYLVQGLHEDWVTYESSKIHSDMPKLKKSAKRFAAMDNVPMRIVSRKTVETFRTLCVIHPENATGKEAP